MPLRRPPGGERKRLTAVSLASSAPSFWWGAPETKPAAARGCLPAPPPRRPPSPSIDPPLVVRLLASLFFWLLRCPAAAPPRRRGSSRRPPVLIEIHVVELAQFLVTLELFHLLLHPLILHLLLVVFLNCPESFDSFLSLAVGPGHEGGDVPVGLAAHLPPHEAQQLLRQGLGLAGAACAEAARAPVALGRGREEVKSRGLLLVGEAELWQYVVVGCVHARDFQVGHVLQSLGH
mmetsp:Transcript_83730/g.211093  ORF Transcript_83730/g.211093 Transcript_83730/m.211093 type:complete len:234 (+) Transcript_83730:142-843(+)